MNKVIVHINKEITPFFNYDESDYEEEFLDVRILINGKDLEMVTKEIDKALDGILEAKQWIEAIETDGCLEEDDKNTKEAGCLQGLL